MHHLTMDMFNYFGFFQAITPFKFYKEFSPESPFKLSKHAKIASKFPKYFHFRAMTWTPCSACYLFWRLNKPSYQYDYQGDSVRPRRQKTRIYAYASVILARKENKGNFARCFLSFLQAFERGFLQEISHINWNE